MNSPGLIQQGAANSYTQATCQSACIANPTCNSIDFNTLDLTCWFGTAVNPPKVVNNPVNHFDLNRNTCLFGSLPATQGLVQNGCVNSWSLVVGINAPGFVQLGSANSYTVANCQAACIAQPSCIAIDFNTQDVTCWLGTDPNHLEFPNPPVNHYDLTRVCSG